MPTVLLGNTAPLDRGEPLDGPVITTISAPDDASDIEVLKAIDDPGDGCWPRHSSERPAWVESDVPDLAEFLGQHLGCRVGRPKGWAKA
jgi:hypothetical protein